MTIMDVEDNPIVTMDWDMQIDGEDIVLLMGGERTVISGYEPSELKILLESEGKTIELFRVR